MKNKMLSILISGMILVSLHLALHTHKMFLLMLVAAVKPFMVLGQKSRMDLYQLRATELCIIKMVIPRGKVNGFHLVLNANQI